MKNKKICCLLFSMVLALGASACSSTPSSGDHEHTWDAGVVTTQPTHIANGVKTYTCSKCGETKTEQIDKIAEHSYSSWVKADANNHKKVCVCGDVVTEAHKWDEGVVTTEPTHLEFGTKTFTCSVCKATKTEQLSKILEHEYGNWVKVDENNHKKVCICGDEVIESHTWDEGVVTTEPTHLDFGEKTYTCSGCKATKTEQLPKIAEHTYGDWQKVDDNYHKKVCACGDEVTEQHSWDEGVVTTEPTHVQFGEKTYTCSVCKGTKIEQLPKLVDHEYGQWIDEVPAKCDADGVKGHYECTCGKYFDEYYAEIEDLTIPALKHSFGTLIPEVKSSCVEHGTAAHYECSNCHNLFDENYVQKTSEELELPLADHTYVHVNVDPATCEKDGTAEHYYCSVCDALFDVDKNPTTAEKLILTATGHKYVKHDAVEPTLTTVGNIEYYSCSGCSDVFTKNGENYTKVTEDQIKVFMPKLVYAGDEMTLASGYTYEVTSGDAARVDGSKLLFEKPGNVTIKVSKDSFEVSYSKTIIDFGNVTGEATDLATVLDAWGYGNKIGDNDVTISYVNNITDAYNGGTVTMNALDYSRPSNTGSNRDRINNMLFLNPSLVTKAVAAGYTHISFYAYIPKMDDQVSTTNLGLYSSTAIGGVEGTGNTIKDGENNGTSWRYQSISLKNLKSGFGIGFGYFAQHLYLTNVKFFGADISSITSSYFQTAKTDRSKDLVNQSLIGKMYSTVSNCESLTYNSTGSTYESDNDGNDYINFARTGISQTVINTPFNGVIISADWLKAAKKAGYNGLAVYFKLPTEATTEAGNFFRMRVGNTALGAYNSEQPGFVNISIDGVADGESIIIGFKGTRLTLSGMTFRTAKPTSAALSWESGRVINSGNLALE